MIFAQSASPNSPIAARSSERTCPERVPTLPFRVLRCESMGTITRKHGLRIERMFHPQSSILVKRSDAVFPRHEVLLAGSVVARTKSKIVALVGPSFHEARESDGISASAL